MYSFQPFYSSEIINSVTSLIDMSFFFPTFTNVIIGLPLTFYIPPTWINLLFLFGALIILLLTWPNHLKQLVPIFSSIGVTPSLSEYYL